MTASEARYAVELLNALDGLFDVRSGFHSAEADFLEFSAFEQEEGGGCGHGQTLVPRQLVDPILAFTEKLIRSELETLNVVPATPTDPQREGK